MVIDLIKICLIIVGAQAKHYLVQNKGEERFREKYIFPNISSLFLFFPIFQLSNFDLCLYFPKYFIKINMYIKHLYMKICIK